MRFLLLFLGNLGDRKFLWFYYYAFSCSVEIADFLVMQELAANSVGAEAIPVEALALLGLVVFVDIRLLFQLVGSVGERTGVLELALARQLPVLAYLRLILDLEALDILAHLFLRAELLLVFGHFAHLGRPGKLLNEGVGSAAEEVGRLFPGVGLFFVLEVVERWRILEVRIHRLAPW